MTDRGLGWLTGGQLTKCAHGRGKLDMSMEMCAHCAPVVGDRVENTSVELDSHARLLRGWKARRPVGPNPHFDVASNPTSAEREM
jgi:hypothetical protein